MATITLEITKFLEIAWTYKDRVIFDREMDKDILAQLSASPNEAIFHIEHRDKVSAVWRAADWELDIRKHLEEKESAERRLAEHEGRKETFAYLRELIITQLGELAGGSMADALAENIITKKNARMAIETFKAQPERLKW